MTAIICLLVGVAAGWLACRIWHHPAIRDAEVERGHEHRIVQLRACNEHLSAQLRAEARWNS